MFNVPEFLKKFFKEKEEVDVSKERSLEEIVDHSKMSVRELFLSSAKDPELEKALKEKCKRRIEDMDKIFKKRLVIDEGMKISVTGVLGYNNFIRREYEKIYPHGKDSYEPQLNMDAIPEKYRNSKRIPKKYMDRARNFKFLHRHLEKSELREEMQIDRVFSHEFMVTRPEFANKKEKCALCLEKKLSDKYKEQFHSTIREILWEFSRIVNAREASIVDCKKMPWEIDWRLGRIAERRAEINLFEEIQKVLLRNVDLNEVQKSVDDFERSMRRLEMVSMEHFSSFIIPEHRKRVEELEIERKLHQENEKCSEVNVEENKAEVIKAPLIVPGVKTGGTVFDFSSDKLSNEKEEAGIKKEEEKKSEISENRKFPEENLLLSGEQKEGKCEKTIPICQPPLFNKTIDSKTEEAGVIEKKNTVLPLSQSIFDSFKKKEEPEKEPEEGKNDSRSLFPLGGTIQPPKVNSEFNTIFKINESPMEPTVLPQHPLPNNPLTPLSFPFNQPQQNNPLEIHPQDFNPYDKRNEIQTNPFENRKRKFEGASPIQFTEFDFSVQKQPDQTSPPEFLFNNTTVESDNPFSGLLNLGNKEKKDPNQRSIFDLDDNEK